MHLQQVSGAMSLPSYFDTAEDYFDYALKFFQQHQHLFNFENIKVLTLDIIQKVDIENLDEVFDGEFTLDVARQNTYLNEFLDECGRISRNVEEFIRDDDLEQEYSVPLTPKKKHEIVYLAKEIDSICKDTNCDTVVDFGSGLGYLDQLINKRSDLKVLGVECNSHHYVAARERQNKYHLNSKQNVKFKKHTITETSDGIIRLCLEQKFFNVGNICLTGLHACGDLTVTAINLFIKMDEAKALIIMPCCYHKMNLIGPSIKEQYFKNFPLSNSLKNISEKYRSFEFLTKPFLRVASQPPSVYENLKDLVFNLLSRAILQVYADKYDLKLIRKKRKTLNKNTKNNIDLYFQCAQDNFGLMCRNCSNDLSEASPKVINDKCSECKFKFNVEELKEMWTNICDLITIRKAAIFILIQRHLQPIFENFILFDRLMYLRENGFNQCYFKKIVDEKISPKCLALIIKK